MGLGLANPIPIPNPTPTPHPNQDAFTGGLQDKVKASTKALELCVLHNITLTEELAENCVPPLGAPGAEEG